MASREDEEMTASFLFDMVDTDGSGEIDKAVDAFEKSFKPTRQHRKVMKKRSTSHRTERPQLARVAAALLR